MCRWRQLQDTYACGDIYRHPDEMVYCLGTNCKFSPNHPDNCENCSKTCWQYRLFPEQIDRQLDRLCPKCERLADEAADKGRAA